MKLFSKLYEKVMTWSRHPHAERYLAGLSFAESSFFPIPPDVMLAPMSLAKTDKAFRFALITTLASVAGGIMGYGIGYWFIDIIQPLIGDGGRWEHAYTQTQEWFLEWGFWAIFVALNSVILSCWQRSLMAFSISLFSSSWRTKVRRCEVSGPSVAVLISFRRVANSFCKQSTVSHCEGSFISLRKDMVGENCSKVFLPLNKMVKKRRVRPAKPQVSENKTCSQCFCFSTGRPQKTTTGTKCTSSSGLSIKAWWMPLNIEECLVFCCSQALSG